MSLQVCVELEKMLTRRVWSFLPHCFRKVKLDVDAEPKPTDLGESLHWGFFGWMTNVRERGAMDDRCSAMRRIHQWLAWSHTLNVLTNGSGMNSDSDRQVGTYFLFRSAVHWSVRQCDVRKRSSKFNLKPCLVALSQATTDSLLPTRHKSVSSIRIIWTDIIGSFQSRGDTYGHRLQAMELLSKLHMVYK